MLTAMLALIVFCGSAAAGEENSVSPEEAAAAAAEADRLSGEIRNLAARQVWSGVERKYRQAVSLGSPLPTDVHLVAAYSARDRGEILAVYDRLTRAASQGATKEVVDWLWDLDHNFGRVYLNADRKGTADLTIKVQPLDPNRRQVVEAAVLKCKETGEFRGLLPRGDYRFVGQEFRVEPGISVRVEVSPKVRRQGLEAPTIVYRELPTAQGQEKK
jgi:hypothetical protein